MFKSIILQLSNPLIIIQLNNVEWYLFCIQTFKSLNNADQSVYFASKPIILQLSNADWRVYFVFKPITIQLNNVDKNVCFAFKHSNLSLPNETILTKCPKSLLCIQFSLLTNSSCSETLPCLVAVTHIIIYIHSLTQWQWDEISCDL